jgi:hypothetical protein
VLVREREKVQEVSRPLALVAAVFIACTAPATTSPVPSPAPSTTSAASTATAAASSGGILDDRFGFVLLDGDATVRSETSSSTIASFAFPARSFVFHSRPISPDGRQVAYWDRMTEGATLNIRGSVGGPSRPVFTAGPGMFGNAFTWSSDGTGLVVATDNGCFGIGNCVSGVAELWTVDLASGATERIGSGKIWLPIAWDRANSLVAAGTSGEGGYLLSYDVIDLRRQPHVVTSTGFEPPVAGRLGASSDARFIALSAFVGSNAVWWWPLALPSSRVDTGAAAQSAVWRPGTSELWWVDGLTPPGCRATPCSGSEVVALDVVTGLRRTVARGDVGTSLAAFRPDGSAAIVGRASTLEITLIDAAAGRTQTIAGRGQLLGSVRVR